MDDDTARADDATPAAGTRRCGVPHHSGVTCDLPRLHDKWAHSSTRTDLDGRGFVQVTVAWVDWDEVAPMARDVVERARQRRLSRRSS